MKICVFCSSSNYLDERYYEEARTLGRLICLQNSGLVYGGTHVGLMGALAGSVRQYGGHITGVIPDIIYKKGIAYDGVDELIVTRDLRERKAMMEKISGAFIALPGGFGTLEEIFEIITLKQLQLLHQPIVFINTLGYFNHLNAFFERVIQDRFVSGRFRGLFYIAETSLEALDYIGSYSPELTGDKWAP